MANLDSNSAIGKSVTQCDVTRKPRIVLGCCGGVATMEQVLVNAFLEWAEVKVVATETSLQFLTDEKAESLFTHSYDIYTDDYFESENWEKIGDYLLPIELAGWADIMVIAPLSPDIVAKIAGGFSDGLLTTIVRAWDYEKPMFVAPSMNDAVWRNPFTEKQLMSIEKLGVTVIPPVEQMPTNMKEMAHPSTISSTVRSFYVSKILKNNKVCEV